MATTDPIKKPATVRKRDGNQAQNTAKQKPRKPRNASKKTEVRSPDQFIRQFLLLIIEISALTVSLGIAVVFALGYSADFFSGTALFANQLPFVIGVLGLIVSSAALLLIWWKLHHWLGKYVAILPSSLAICLACSMTWFAWQHRTDQVIDHFRLLVGGKQEASRITLAHQVYAAYRRYNPAELLQIVKRAESYRSEIEQAADAFEIDVNLLQGIAATESSFLPRDSRDGGRGLFQITRVPKSVIEQVSRLLAVNKPSVQIPKHNAFIAAATLKYYLTQMQDDLFLGLLAYNIGPANGGLHFIMQQYKATDFITIQPYLQRLPRDYPIRVLSYALAFRLWQREGKLPVYEEGENALHIQRIGIPGLQASL